MVVLNYFISVCIHTHISSYNHQIKSLNINPAYVIFKELYLEDEST